MTEELLYHYTNDTALLKMLEHRTFWATDTDFLNDSSERSYAAALLDDDMRQHMPVARLDEAGRVAALARGLRRLYVVCFTSHHDLLGLWRGYGRGQGYALGFAASDLRGLQSPWGEEGTLRLEKVVYGPEALGSMKARLLATSERPAARVAALETLMVTTKHKAFEYEDETRIIASQLDLERSARANKEILFRAGRFAVVPYVEVSWKDIPLRCVVLGPGPHEEVREAGVRLALERHQHTDVEIVRSQAPYRE